MVDQIFSHPRLAQVYDAFGGDRTDLAAYLAITQELGAKVVLDVGCGTGSFAHLLAMNGCTVTAVDPARASLDIARSKHGANSISWMHGGATGLPPVEADLAVMTGNVAQVFLTDQGWTDALRSVRGALNANCHLAFETRRPERRVWEDWALDTAPVVREVPGVGEVERRRVVTGVEGPRVSFRYTYRFASDGHVLTSDSTIRFRTRGELEQSLARSGYDVLEVREAPDRPGHEYVFIARRKS